MSEKVAVSLSDADVTVFADPDARNTISFKIQCPLCETWMILTRVTGKRCDCGMDWSIDLKAKANKTLTDDEKFQQPLPFKELPPKE